ncbi:MAG: DUF5671 domain-containing protein [Pseudomonadota bacterium]
MADQQLLEFVDSSLRAGATKTEIEAALKEAAWSPDQINKSLASFANVDFVVPVPTPKVYVSARDAFRYVIVFAMLYLSAFYLGDLLFQFVTLGVTEHAEPRRVSYVYSSIRWATSGLIIAYPIYLYLSYRIAVEIAADPASRVSAVRRWLTYLTLAIAALVIVADLILLLYNFLSGDLTLRFLLKTLIVLCIAGAIFGYYLRSIRLDDEALSR